MEVPAKKKPAADTRCHFHRSHQGRTGSARPSGWFCRLSLECKHAKAGTVRREGEPSSIADLAAATEAKLARDRRLTPATPEQIAELRSARGAQ